ncbi:MAG: ABC transporter permease, partial [Phycisphaerae bacterium]
MFYLRLTLTALRSLESNFMRSLLATLGVLIGVSSVLACMSILEGASNKVINDFKSLGSNVLYVMPSVARIEGRSVGAAQTLVLADIEKLTRDLRDEIDSISP